jgi:Protein of unknown function (DUF4435)
VREFLTPNDYANELRMRHGSHQRTFIIVEGDSDAKLYRQLTDANHCELVIARNRNMAIAILEILQEPIVPGVIAIVDKDFDELNGLLPDIPNLFFTDTHDLETMLLRSPALEKLLSEFGSEEKLKRFGNDVRETVLTAGCAVGYLLWISLEDSLHLTFENINFSAFIDKETLKIDELMLIKEVKNKSQRHDLDVKDLQQRLKQQKDPSHDRWQVCRGHDFMAILYVGLLKAIGSKSSNLSNLSKEVAVTILERSLRLAYEQAYFQTTELYAAIGIWETHHHPYRILKLI